MKSFSALEVSGGVQNSGKFFLPTKVDLSLVPDFEEPASFKSEVHSPEILIFYCFGRGDGMETHSSCRFVFALL